MISKIISTGIGKIFFIILAYGIFAGLFLGITWPDEGIQILLNVPGMLLGDQMHLTSVDMIGDPTSSDAFHTVPLILRQPYVYLLSSILFWGLLGFGIQCLIRRIQNNTKKYLPRHSDTNIDTKF
ncbi:MAG: hypothetical protein J4F36_01295 [Nitrosopumilaceae archaeon]|nr:hypothetical protein [Nitrosopumilaceae archaeon]